ncbi:MAG: hypothetical protein U0793_22935 [Gemmataceae bacterium]
MLFASLVIEREPMQWSELPMALRSWAQVVGTLAAACLLIWLIAYVIQNHRRGLLPRDTTGWAFLTFVALAAGLFLFVGLTLLGRAINIRVLAQMAPTGNARQPSAADWALAFAGLSALIAVATPVVLDLIFKMSWRRIWALAKLSLKEAIRSKVVLIFALIALVFLFADWFVPYKPEDQVRNYVAVIYMSLPPLFLITTTLLGSFSIPADIRSQSIHTVVTKPVEKFEIVLGRFLGYAILITVGLAVVASLSLLYVLRGIHPDAEKESFKARVPIFGFLGFEGTKGENVGRVWDYRRYIGGRNLRDPAAKEQYAVWWFDEAPEELGERSEPVQMEFTFDIYRMTKGTENRGVFCNFVVADGRLEQDAMTAAVAELNKKGTAYRQIVKVAENQEGTALVPALRAALADVQKRMAVDEPRLAPPALALAEKRSKGGAARADLERVEQEIRSILGEGGKEAGLKGEDAKRMNALRAQAARSARQEVDNLLALVYGVHSAGSIEVKDYHTQTVDLPAELFTRLNALDHDDPRTRRPDGARLPMFRVWVNIDTSGPNRFANAPQMVGMARPDLYLLAAEKPFWQNFFKGIIGLWFVFLLVLGVAVPLSTYLSGVISWLATMFLFGAGLFREFVEHLAEGRIRPMDSLYRILTQTFHSGRLEPTGTTSTFQSLDEVYAFFFRIVLNVIPDVQRFDLQEYVANGFDISWGRVLFLDCFLPLIGYLVPWMILGYYLIKNREIANPH